MSLAVPSKGRRQLEGAQYRGTVEEMREIDRLEEAVHELAIKLGYGEKHKMTARKVGGKWTVMLDDEKDKTCGVFSEKWDSLIEAYQALLKKLQDDKESD